MLDNVPCSTDLSFEVKYEHKLLQSYFIPLNQSQQLEPQTTQE